MSSVRLVCQSHSPCPEGWGALLMRFSPEPELLRRAPLLQTRQFRMCQELGMSAERIRKSMRQETVSSKPVRAASRPRFSPRPPRRGGLVECGGQPWLRKSSPRLVRLTPRGRCLPLQMFRLSASEAGTPSLLQPLRWRSDCCSPPSWDQARVSLRHRVSPGPSLRGGPAECGGQP
jgi:hypothetical protein